MKFLSIATAFLGIVAHVGSLPTLEHGILERQEELRRSLLYDAAKELPLFPNIMYEQDCHASNRHPTITATVTRTIGPDNALYPVRWRGDHGPVTTTLNPDDDLYPVTWRDDNGNHDPVTTTLKPDDDLYPVRWRDNDGPVTTTWSVDDDLYPVRWRGDNSGHDPVTSTLNPDDDLYPVRWREDDGPVTTTWTPDDDLYPVRWRGDNSDHEPVTSTLNPDDDLYPVRWRQQKQARPTDAAHGRYAVGKIPVEEPRVTRQPSPTAVHTQTFPIPVIVMVVEVVRLAD